MAESSTGSFSTTLTLLTIYLVPVFVFGFLMTLIAAERGKKNKMRVFIVSSLGVYLLEIIRVLIEGILEAILMKKDLWTVINASLILGGGDLIFYIIYAVFLKCMWLYFLLENLCYFAMFFAVQGGTAEYTLFFLLVLIQNLQLFIVLSSIKAYFTKKEEIDA